MAYDARYIFIRPPSVEALESRLRDSGVTEDEIKVVLGRAPTEIKLAATRGFDKIIVNNTVEAACKCLEAFIYGLEDDGKPAATGTADVSMANGAES